MTLGSRNEIVADHLPETAELSIRESTPIAGEPLGLLKPQLEASVGGLVLEVGQESLSAVEYLDATSGNIGLCLSLHLLPALSPEPRLIGGVRQQRMQLDDTVVALDDLDLRARLV